MKQIFSRRLGSPFARGVAALMVAGLAAFPAGAAAASSSAASRGTAIDAYIAAYNARDAKALAAVYTEDATFSDVSQRKEVAGRAAIGDMMIGLVGIHTEMDVRVKRQATTGELTMVEVVYAGTIDASLLGREDLGLVSYELPGVLIFEIEGDRIARQIDYLDFRTFTETFGAFQAPAP